MYKYYEIIKCLFKNAKLKLKSAIYNLYSVCSNCIHFSSVKWSVLAHLKT